MSNAQISAQEQLLIELMNRARLDPAGEATRYGISLNNGLAAGTISTAPKAPLASNTDLSEAAASHSEWMLSTDTFSHTGAGGSRPGARMSDAGYSFSGSWSWGENISWRGTTGSVDLTAMALEQHKSLFLSSGHRVNILGNFREVGVGQEVGSYSGYNASMVTEDFARSGTRAFITGAAFQDRDGDAFYDVGEGTGGVTVDWLGNAGGAATSQAAGGYNVAIPLGLSGSATVAITAGGITMQASLGMTGTNMKLDLVSGRTLASSTDITLGQNALDGRLLGTAPLRLTGNELANKLEGNNGGNSLSGAAGNDTIIGGKGNDRIEGGTGDDRLTGDDGADSFVFVDQSGSTTGHDQITSLGSGDRIIIDLVGTLPSEATWERDHIAATTTGWRITLDDGATIDVTGGTLALLENTLTLA